MAGIIASWQAAPGMEPPPPYAADSFKGFVKYRGGWVDAWQFSDEATDHLIASSMPNGEYQIAVCGYRNGVYSQPAFKTYAHTTGTDPIDPVYGSPPPTGSADVATPEMLTVTEAP
jgi:hypothetical protein